MGVKAKKTKREPSPPPSYSQEMSSSGSSSEASSSRSAMPTPKSAVGSDSDEQAQPPKPSSQDDIDEDEDEDVASDDEDAPSDADSDSPPTIDRAKARTKLHHVSKTLRATAKKTKTFEVQKLVKKLKGLQKKESLAAQAKLAEAELAALKSIDINLLAGRALVTKMVKAKLLPKHAEQVAADDEGYIYLEMVKEEALLGEEVLSDPVATDGDKALERAKAKITSSKVLADEVGKFVDELKKLVGIEPIRKNGKEAEVGAKGKGKAKLEDTEDENEEERQWSGSEEEEDSDEEAPQRLPLVDDDQDEELETDDEEELERIGREKLAALGDLSQWDDLIGFDSAAESGSDAEEEPPRKTKSKRPRHGSESEEEQSDDDDEDDDDSDGASDSEEDNDSYSSSDSDSDASYDDDRPRKRKSSSKSLSERSAKKSKKSSSSSTFLPSLSTGFIAGRSDDEWSDAEADLADWDLSELKSGGKKERKNRMGQRARKALYEKKYGKNANHIKMREKRKAEKAERGARPPPRQTGGVQGGRQRQPAFQAPSKRDGGWGGPVAPLPKQPKRPYVPRDQPGPAPAPASMAAKGPAPKSGGDKTQEMHPSWIAKQKQKELMAQVKPQGKKVVFD